MEAIKLEGLPLPPSANALHRAIGRGKVIKSAKFNEYEAACRIWMLTNFHQLAPARAFVAGCGPGRFIHVDMEFKFKKAQILTNGLTPKKLDLDNRIKALYDACSKMLHIDDCWFWSMTAKKMVAAENVEPGVTFIMSLVDAT